MNLEKYINEDKYDDYNAIKNDDLNFSFYLQIDSHNARFSFSKSPNFTIDINARDLRQALWKLDKDKSQKAIDNFYDLAEAYEKKEMRAIRSKLVKESQNILDTAFSLIRAKLQEASIKVLKDYKDITAKVVKQNR